MSDIIHLLPDSIANQIAAGEVIQRPASVVKELIENAIDAEATKIQIIIKEAGRTSIQVIDNGKGMSETDARMAFERHATSKIKTAADLFDLRTMGFRGEALPSIASISHVELKTRQADKEVGVLLELEGDSVRQEVVSCPKGTSFIVKNLFYNVPARRKFLKSNNTEFRHILNEVNRVALAYPQIAFTLIHGENEIYNLPESNLKQRIINVFGKKMNQQLLPIEVHTSLANIYGFVGKAEFASKMNPQYFFVNNRYMRHPYFHKAVSMAYDRMLKNEEMPSYFIYFDVNPASIDINVHPTKTEIKFENEKDIWQVLMVAVKESLGKFNVVPSIDFDTEGAIEIPIANNKTIPSYPKVTYDDTYSPFPKSPKTANNWEVLYQLSKKEEPCFVTDEKEINLIEEPNTQENKLFETNQSESKILIYKNKYILQNVKSGLMMIHFERAHQQILYEKFLEQFSNQKLASQQLLFPEIIELTAEENIVFNEIKEHLQNLGFCFSDFGKQMFSINGIPAEISTQGSIVNVIKDLIFYAKETNVNLSEKLNERLALTLAKTASFASNQTLSETICSDLIDKIFACKQHKQTSDGKIIITILENSDIEQRF